MKIILLSTAVAITSAFQLNSARSSPVVVSLNSCRNSQVDQQFRDLQNELFQRSRPNSRRQQESFRRQQEWIRDAFGLANEFVEAMDDVSAGRATPRYEVNDSDTSFSVSMDVPGVKMEDMEVEVNEKEYTLKISGTRNKMNANDSVSFEKTFDLDTNLVYDQVTARLNDGVLQVSIPKQKETEQDKFVKKIEIQQGPPPPSEGEDTIDAELSP